VLGSSAGFSTGPLGGDGTTDLRRDRAGATSTGPAQTPQNALVRFSYSLSRTDLVHTVAVLTDQITSLLSQYGYAAICVLMLLESACIPIPSEVTMLFGGALTSAAFAGSGNELELFWVIVAGVSGNLVGSWLAFWAGVAGGRPMVDRFGRYLLIRPHEVDRAHAFFERRGDATVFVARLLPVVRTFISLPAGIAEMPLGKFTLYTTLGCIPFVTALAFLGHAAGANWPSVEGFLAPFSWLIAGVLVVLGSVYVARRWRQVRAEYAAIDAQRGASEPEA
jgi:membrane protein DedA with SNARE-associated domain